MKSYPDLTLLTNRKTIPKLFRVNQHDIAHQPRTSMFNASAVSTEWKVNFQSFRTPLKVNKIGNDHDKLVTTCFLAYSFS